MPGPTELCQDPPWGARSEKAPEDGGGGAGRRTQEPEGARGLSEGPPPPPPRPSPSPTRDFDPTFRKNGGGEKLESQPRCRGDRCVDGDGVQ